MPQKNHKRLNEQGFASIAIALVLIIVLSLLTVGFAQLARREQQTALDKQLANQAYYAAESGINDAYKAIKTGTLTTSTPNEGGSQCLGLPLPGSGPADLSTQNGVSYTCVLVNLTPTALVKDIPDGGDWSTYFSTVGASPDSVTLSWTNQAGKPPKPPRPTDSGFTPSASWNAPAVLQFSVTPLSSFARSDLINNTFTVYAYPSTTSSSASYSTAVSDQGKIVDGGCTSGVSGSCHIQITGLPAGVSLYAIHVHDTYDDAHVVVGAESGATSLALGDSQATIDVTGKAREVLKRILVHVPINPSPDLPNEALQAQDICKYFTTDPVANTVTAPLPGYGAGVTDTCDVTH